MQMLPECLLKAGGPSILAQRALSLRDALTPAKDHDSKRQLGRRIAHHPQERAISSQHPQRDPFEQDLAQSLDPWCEWEEPCDRRHPARHAIQRDEYPPKMRTTIWNKSLRISRRL